MRLYLVRHAEATVRNGQSDRPLDERGVEDTKRLASFLAPLGLRVQAIWHSGKARTLQTAELLASSVCADQGLVQRDDLNPNDKIRPVIDDVEDMEADLMIVGHQPFLGKLASKMVAGSKSADVLVFPKGAMVCLETTRLGKWQVAWVLAPDLLVKAPSGV
ncbi:MAG: phosphohistidine phosphatase SixA [Bacillota bacterium]